MEYIYLIFSGIFEVLMVYALNCSRGFKILRWTIATLILAGLSLETLSLAMTWMEAGIAYSIWVAFGSIGSIILGVVMFHDKLKAKQLSFMALIIVAVIGLKIWG
ncbi:DMT family transporter [Limosilactobacillus caccae]|uniref:DMT family transporter n=1 Tax=Limosilactobacillus caccae TaxID=1926284 RepID=UPI000970827C|nr:SMR family transporter [Limosilactobacillus caccae]